VSIFFRCPLCQTMLRMCLTCGRSKDRDTDFQNGENWMCAECNARQATGEQPYSQGNGAPLQQAPHLRHSANGVGEPKVAVLKAKTQEIVPQPEPNWKTPSLIHGTDVVATKDGNHKATVGHSKGRKKRRVGMLSVVTMKSIDNVKGEASLSLEIYLHYDCPVPFTPKPEGPHFERLHPEDMHDFTPVHFRVLETIEFADVGHTVLQNNKTGTVFEILRYNFTVREILELRSFPFDRQIFKVKLSSWKCDFEPWFAPAHDSIQQVRDDPVLKANDAVAIFEGTEWTLDWVRCTHEQGAGAERITLLTFGMSRTPTFYLWNLGMIIFVVVELATFTAAIDYTTFADRANLTFTLLLTYIAFQFVASTFVPPTNYLTYLDKYVHMGLFMLSALIVESFLIAKVHMANTDLAHHLDTMFFVAFNVIWLGMHAVIVVGTTREWFRPPWSCALEEDESERQCVGSSQAIPE